MSTNLIHRFRSTPSKLRFIMEIRQVSELLKKKNETSDILKLMSPLPCL